MTRVLLVVVLAACPLLAGCLVGWAYPTYSYCPGTTVLETPDDVFAVRVDVVQGYTSFCNIHHETHTFNTVRVDGWDVPSDFQPHVAYGGGWFPFMGHVTHYSMTKLYRRGFHTIVLEPGLKRAQVEWQPTTSLEEDEAAIRDLLYRSRTRKPDEPQLDGPGTCNRREPTISPKVMSAAHRQTLLFAADEFERLAALHTRGSDAEVRLRAEVKMLRELAAQ
jgi:hypothetical protein